MKRILPLLIFLTLAQTILAQSTIKIDLADWKGKKDKLPFQITSVSDQRSNTTLIGITPISKKKNAQIEFKRNSAKMIQRFINKNFTQKRNDELQMDIETLEIKPVNIKGKMLPHLFFSCKFYFQNNLNQPLYTFQARNIVPRKKSLQIPMTNYVGRAIRSALIQFKKSYEEHPEWRQGVAQKPQVNIKKTIKYNQFTQLGDTIGLDGRYQLKNEDFAGIFADNEQDDAYSYLMLSYNLEALDENNTISLNIHPKAFFLRSKSWSKKTDSIDWKGHQQLLFDLTSYYGLLLKQRLEQKQYSAGYYKAEVNKIYNQTNKEYTNELDQLQADTLYGAFKEKEKEWRLKVDKYLNKLKD